MIAGAFADYGWWGALVIVILLVVLNWLNGTRIRFK